MTQQAFAVYVAPDGKDSNPGSPSEPLGSIGEAIIRARKSGAEEKRIVVRGGRYYDVAITLTEEDSNLAIEAFEGESPVLYGGLPVMGWEPRGEVWAAKLEGVLERCRDFRVLEIGGESRPRARLPESGAYRHRNRFDVPWMSTLSGGWARQPTEEEMTVLHYEEGDLGAWLDVHNAEITVYHEWDESLVGLSGIDPDAKTVTFEHVPGHPPGAFADRNDHANEYVVWNIREGLTRPGQWFLDRSNGELVYKPLPGERPDRLQAVAPVSERILHLEGGVQRVRIKGLTFACSAAPLVPGGFGAAEVGAAISGDGVRDIAFEDVTVRHTGGWAFRFEGDRIRLAGCHIHHTGAGGVHYYGNDVTLDRCRIHDVGVTYQSAVAVMGSGNGNAIRHNDIFDTPYSGIVETGTDTAIEGNLFHRVMTFMKDGAAVYGSGAKRVSITGNAMLADPGRKTRSYAYYLDELCEDGTVEGNLAVGAGLPMLSHMTRNCRYVNNVFWDPGIQKITAANTFGLTFERNVLAADSIEFYAPRGNPDNVPSTFDAYPSMQAYSKANGIVSLKNNVLYSRSGRITFHEFVHYEVIREFALEPADGNVFADPLLAGFSSGAVTWGEESPAGGLGIRPLSFADAGCSGRFAELLRFFGGA